ncbi:MULTISPECIES: adenylyl-sulfate kinase [Burkholderia]|uniref:adenylyl-sulfate kinase n=1 Tax=Burkholderia TaxID=32008 RepID=UPI0009B57072|nr:MULTISPECIES: adenylyl-sulfate kinase [Burkholderia]MBO7812736.1 adenylyl-sulfate kinase [Burkholderia pseudomallei]MCS6598200.1 adenylyl-sulfate kinase [Burkholderia pseudomallei]MDA0561035.1 adenylyl-sulfate kinase [Burkholderia pseudomallei]PNW98947.1 adenylyl-sulfate kinase [Burkholderia sp. 136(2017)]PNX09682.1 adenylyl-sulfate kinase [Burkholderia sp. 129]
MCPNATDLLRIDKFARSSIKRQKACAIWLTGLSGAGKSTIATLADQVLFSRGNHTYILDGDEIRSALNKDLGFDALARSENIRRVSELARLMVDSGLIVLCALISPFRHDRSLARSRFAPGEFYEVFVDAPLPVAEARDPKGLYQLARRGEIRGFTGIDSEYEPPEFPDLHLRTDSCTPTDAVASIIKLLENNKIIGINHRSVPSDVDL